ncbi:MAG: hypothetical protein ACLSAP_04795 [Oscillospiraceae bacterium]
MTKSKDDLKKEIEQIESSESLEKIRIYVLGMITQETIDKKKFDQKKGA